MELYVRVSRAIRSILDRFSPSIEPLSIDEAFVDLTGIARDLEAGCETARQMKLAIRTEQQLTASVGVAPNKFLAKVASDLEKPDGLVAMPLEALAERLWPLHVRRLWGVGPRTAERLERGGIRTIGDLLDAPPEGLAARVGKGSAAHLVALARGEDDRPVERDRVAKSVSEERTYAEDLRDPAQIDRALLARAEGVARHLRRMGLTGRTVHLKVRTGDFTTWTRARTLAAPTDLTEPIVAAARRLLAERISTGGRGLRLLGVGVSGLESAGAGQQALFTDPREARSRRLAHAADTVRRRLGEGTLTRARLLGRPPRRRGEDDDPPAEASSLPSVD